MRLTRLAIDNLLSFEHFELDQIDPSLTTIVGPNGAGKTNIVRVLNLVMTALDWAEDRAPQVNLNPSSAQGILDTYVAARYRSADEGDALRVELGIELTSAAEHEQLTCFVQSAIISMVLSRSQRREQDGPVLAKWAVEWVTPERLSPLMSGTLVLEHPGSAPAPWQVSYQFRHDDTDYCWMLADIHGGHGIVTIDDCTGGGRAQFQPVDLAQALFDITSDQEPLPASLPEFSFGKLCPERGKMVDLQVQVGSFYRDLEPHRRFDEIVGLPSLLSTRNWELTSVLRPIVRRGVVVVGEQLRGIDLAGRSLPFGRYSLDQLSRSDATWEPSTLPLRLFHLKNGGGSERQRFERIRDMFESFAPGRQMDVRFEAVVPTSMPPQPVLSSYGGLDLKHPTSTKQPTTEPDPEFVITVVIGEVSEKDSWELPVTLTGAGVWEALVVAEAVADSDDRVIVLDEPALNLHPTWQTALRQALQTVSGQVLLVTHSPHLVPMEEAGDLTRLVRISNDGGGSCCRRLAPTLYKEEAKITREFALSADARALLFSRGVVIASGETEQGALPIWCAKSKAAEELGTPAAKDIGFYSTPGDSGFRTILSVMHGFGIPWVLVCDGKSFDIKTNWCNHIFRQIEQAGIDIPELKQFIGHASKGGKQTRCMTQALWDKQVDLGTRHGVFTLTTSWTGDAEGFEGFIEGAAPGKLAEARAEVGSSKIRKGRWVAQQTDCPEEVDDLYRQIVVAIDRGFIDAPSSGGSPSRPGGTIAP